MPAMRITRFARSAKFAKFDVYQPTVRGFARVARVLCALVLLVFTTTFARNASAAGSFKVKTSAVDEVAGEWHLVVTIELPTLPLVAHQSMKFVFTKTVAYKRTLVDGHDGPVNTREVLPNQLPVVESFDVAFADLTGKIFKITRFDVSLTRPRFDAGEYRIDLRTADGVVIGGPQFVALKGDNEVDDARTMQFSAKDKSMRKVNAYDAGASASGANNPLPASAGGNGEVTPTGTAQPFIPKEGFQRTTEEEIKTRPSGCGCSVPGSDDGSSHRLGFWLTSFAGIGIALVRRRSA